MARNDTVDVWIFSHTHPPNVSTSLQGLLDNTESTRAEKFYHAALKNQYIVRHAILRQILSLYVGQDAKTIEFLLGQNGKPMIANSDLHFNLSHSHNMVSLAVTKNPIIGIDIEYNKPISDVELVAKHHFSETEQSMLFDLAQSEQAQAFYLCWTRKEAFIKSDGRGLQVPLDSFDVTLAPEDSSQLLRIGSDIQIASSWTMQDLILPDNYIGVVLVFGKIKRLRYWHVNLNGIF